ncbi:hypothetical protein WJL_1072 [Lactiplantibacillus plantarum WJL]|uniref:Uncharacterized protein n=1 Tax=Lactiplantibacillus plantarum WJL TaxID=1350466 RepID=A0A837P8H2_LACPN|nr:hypothetical protein WJL_1072 [Lactiplantibacillus plantarum WJL]
MDRYFVLIKTTYGPGAPTKVTAKRPVTMNVPQSVNYLAI